MCSSDLSLGRREGEIDFDTSFVGAFGTMQPSARPSTWQDADTRLATIGAGYAVGTLGPLLDQNRLDLAAFKGRGGKAIVFQGWQDPVVNAIDTIAYYERLRDQRETVEASRRPPVRHTLAATP